MKKTRSKTFVYASSSEVYGDPLQYPQTEDYWGNVNPIGERSCYNEGKRFGEALCMSYLRKYSLDIKIVRIFNTYGPNMKKNDGRVISNFIVQGLQNKPLTIYGNGQQTRSFCYVSDLVKGLYLAGIKPAKGEVINLGNDDEKKIIEIAKLVKKLTSSKSKIVFKAGPKDDPKKRKPNLDKAYKLLQWRPTTPLEEGLNSSIKYFKKRFNL
jgi:nucleoside-diphosphate-sugar epimerase